MFSEIQGRATPQDFHGATKNHVRNCAYKIARHGIFSCTSRDVKKAAGHWIFSRTSRDVKKAAKMALTGFRTSKIFSYQFFSFVNFFWFCHFYSTKSQLFFYFYIFWNLRWISTRRNDRRFRREITTKSISHETIYLTFTWIALSRLLKTWHYQKWNYYF